MPRRQIAAVSNMKTSQKLHLAQEALGGLSAGIVGTIIGYPLDLVKTRMQTSSGASSSSIVRVASGIVRREGILALYKGMAPPLLSLSILNVLNFSSFSFFRDLYHAKHGWDYRNAIAGMSGAPVGAMVSTVENLVKTQMQLDNIPSRKRPRFEGSWHCVRSLVQSHGPSVLYTGHAVNSLREMTFLGCYFFTYEGLRHLFVTGSHVPAQLAVPVAGGLAGALSWFVSFPLDCVRAGVQGHDLDDLHRVRAWRVLKNLIRTRGMGGLYSGVTPSIARAFLVSASRFSAYEGALWLLHHGGHGDS